MGRQRCGLLSWHQVLSLAFLFWAELFASWRNLSKTYIEQLDGEADEQRKQKEKERKLWKGAFFFFWCEVCPEHPVFRTEIFLHAWNLVYMTAFCSMPFWNMTKTGDSCLL